MRYLLIISFVLIILITIFPSSLFCLENFFNDFSANYLYSSLLQANAAIFAITGIFVIFKIQSIDLHINLLLQQMIKIIPYDSFAEFETKDLKDKNKCTEEYKQQFPKSAHLLLDNRMTLENCRKNLLSSLTVPLFILAVGILINSIGLFLANYIHNLNNAIEFKMLSVVIIIEFSIVIIVVSHIFKTLKFNNLTHTAPDPPVGGPVS